MAETTETLRSLTMTRTGAKVLFKHSALGPQLSDFLVHARLQLAQRLLEPGQLVPHRVVLGTRDDDEQRLISAVESAAAGARTRRRRDGRRLRNLARVREVDASGRLLVVGQAPSVVCRRATYVGGRQHTVCALLLQTNKGLGHFTGVQQAVVQILLIHSSRREFLLNNA